MAAVYSREIGEQYDCGDCARAPSLWEERGRCVGPLPEGVRGLSLRMDSDVYGHADYPVEFTTCPRGLLRADLRPVEAATAVIVSHAAAAELDKRYPDVPGRIYDLVQVMRRTEAERSKAEAEARTREIKNRHGSD